MRWMMSLAAAAIAAAAAATAAAATVMRVTMAMIKIRFWLARLLTFQVF
jgi:hypothetical protein